MQEQKSESKKEKNRERKCRGEEGRETKRVNIFDQTSRKIRCIEVVHYYLGNGFLITEEKLKKGEEYTFCKGVWESYGSMVFLEEVPSRFGFQSYLFEELNAYEEEILKEAYERGLLEKLGEAMKQIGKEEVRYGNDSGGL